MVPAQVMSALPGVPPVRDPASVGASRGDDGDPGRVLSQSAAQLLRLEPARIGDAFLASDAGGGLGVEPPLEELARIVEPVGEGGSQLRAVGGLGQESGLVVGQRDQH